MTSYQNIQTRNFNSNFKIRETYNLYQISGYFAKFNIETELIPGVFEKIKRTAFNKTISDDIRALANHDTTLVLGRTKANTLKIKVDEVGLYGTIQINPKDRDAINIYERVKRGDISQCSFGFEILKESYYHDSNNNTHWVLEEIRLHEVSVCTFPAYDDTSVYARQSQVSKSKIDIEVIKRKLKTKLKKASLK